MMLLLYETGHSSWKRAAKIIAIKQEKIINFIFFLFF